MIETQLGQRRESLQRADLIRDAAIRAVIGSRGAFEVSRSVPPAGGEFQPFDARYDLRDSTTGREFHLIDHRATPVGPRLTFSIHEQLEAHGY
jgi:hypothetical protein